MTHFDVATAIPNWGVWGSLRHVLETPIQGFNNRGIDVTLPPYSAGSAKTASFNAGAVQDAITAAGEGGRIIIPELLSVDTQIATTAIGQSIEGVGREESGLTASMTMAALLLVQHGGFSGREFRLDANNAATTALKLDAAGDVNGAAVVERVAVFNALGDGVMVDTGDGSYFATFSVVNSRFNNGNGFNVKSSGTTNGIHLTNCVAFQNSAAGLQLTSTHGRVYGGHYGGNGTYGIVVGGPSTASQGNYIIGSWLEANTTDGGLFEWGAIRTLVIQSWGQDWRSAAAMPAARVPSNVVLKTDVGLHFYSPDSSGTKSGGVNIANYADTVIQAAADGLILQADRLGFFDAAAVSKPTVTGSTDSAKIASIISALSTLGLVTDSTA